MTEKAEDKRIGKSKIKMKNALMRLLNRKSLGDITVIQICLAANVTRLTFYKYYTDKYALAEEMFRDMAGVTDERFLALQNENNRNRDPALSYCNLLDCILNLFYGKDSILPFSLRRENLNLYLAFSKYLSKSVADLGIEEHIRFSCPQQMIGDFLCDGLWGFICEGRREKMPVDEIRAKAKRLIQVVVTDNIEHEKVQTENQE